MSETDFNIVVHTICFILVLNKNINIHNSNNNNNRHCCLDCRHQGDDDNQDDDGDDDGDHHRHLSINDKDNSFFNVMQLVNPFI